MRGHYSKHLLMYRPSRRVGKHWCGSQAAPSADVFAGFHIDAPTAKDRLCRKSCFVLPRLKGGCYR